MEELTGFHFRLSGLLWVNERWNVKYDGKIADRAIYILIDASAGVNSSFLLNHGYKKKKTIAIML